MRAEIRARLVALNRAFYNEFAAPFAASRQQPQPGFERLATHLPTPCPSLLDVGAGDGRLGRGWLRAGLIESYTAVDFSPQLLAQGGATKGTYLVRDVMETGALDDLGTFTAVACLAMLHHVPGQAQRAALVAALAARLAPGGRLLLSTWQFHNNPRQQRKIVPWESIGLTAEEVEPGDHLLRWRRGGEGVRYAAAIDPIAIAGFASAAGLTRVDHFHSDGREGNLGYYSVWARGK